MKITPATFIEGEKAFRDQYIDRVEVLDSVKKLEALPDNEHLTQRQVLDYFEITQSELQTVLILKRDELIEDGMKKLNSSELIRFKNEMREKFGNDNAVKGTFALIVFPKKAVLRIGMVLTGSKVAAKLRDKLIKIAKEDKGFVKKSSLKYNGSWTDELDAYVFERIKTSILSGEQISITVTEVATEIQATPSQVNTRWYQGNKFRKPLKESMTDKEKILYKQVKDKMNLERINQRMRKNNDDSSKTTECQKEEEDNNKISEEINAYQRVAGEAALEIGRRLKRVKENNLTHDEYEKQLASVGIENKLATKFVKVYEEFGNIDSYQKLGLRAFSDITVSQTGHIDLDDEIINETQQENTQQIKVLNEQVSELKEANAALTNEVKTLISTIEGAFNPEYVQKVLLEVSKLKKEIQDHNLVVNNTYGERIRNLEDDNAKLLQRNKKLTLANRKADKYISQFVLKNVETKETQSAKFKMERNGNLISVN